MVGYFQAGSIFVEYRNNNNKQRNQILSYECLESSRLSNSEIVFFLLLPSCLLLRLMVIIRWLNVMHYDIESKKQKYVLRITAFFSLHLNSYGAPKWISPWQKRKFCLTSWWSFFVTVQCLHLDKYIIVKRVVGLPYFFFCLLSAEGLVYFSW